MFPGCYMLSDVCEVICLSGPSDLNACDSFAVMSHFHGDQLKGEVGTGDHQYYLKRELSTQLCC